MAGTAQVARPCRIQISLQMNHRGVEQDESSGKMCEASDILERLPETGMVSIIS